MRQELKADFNRRIVSANPTQMIVVLYDMIAEDFLEAENAFLDNNEVAAKEALRHASIVLDHLQNALNFKYEMSAQLFSLYDFSKRAIAKSIYKNDMSGVAEAKRVLDPLAKSFTAIAANDNSKPMMKNTQTVYAGMTYGRDSVTETTHEANMRGYFA